MLAAAALLGFFILQEERDATAAAVTMPSRPVPQPAVEAPVVPGIEKRVAAETPVLPDEPGVSVAKEAAPADTAVPAVRKPLVPSYYSDPFIPMKWRALPENTPLKRLVQQAVLPRPEGFQPSADLVKVKQAVDLAAEQIPVAFADPAPETIPGAVENRQLAEIQDKFIDDVSNLPGQPTDADYQRAWRLARLEANDRFTAMFGMDAFNLRQQALLKNPE